MSNAVNAALHEQFMDTLERVGVCPYCSSEIQFEPTEQCCHEVHGELGYKDEDGNCFVESELEEFFNAWLAKRGEP